MKRTWAAGCLLVSLASVALIGGCRAGGSKDVAPVANIAQPDNGGLAGFVKTGELNVQPETPVTGLYVRGDTVFVYTDEKKVYSLSRGLDIKSIKQIVRPDLDLRPPVVVGDQVVFPSMDTLEIYGKEGQFIGRRRLTHSMSSDAKLDQRGYVIAGTSSQTGGRLAVIDPAKSVLPVIQDVLVGNVIGAPAAFQGIIYVATNTGKVFAIAPENQAVWPLDGGDFTTDQSVVADMVVDDYAVYVASTDTKLYALDRATGKIRWRFMAQEPLKVAPYVTSDRVYQISEKAGLAAINKVDGEFYRVPLWTLPGAQRVLGVDDKHVFVLSNDGSIVGVDKDSGKPKFSVGGGFEIFAVSTPDDPTLYAATRGGKIVSFKVSKYGKTDLASR